MDRFSLTTMTTQTIPPPTPSPHGKLRINRLAHLTSRGGRMSSFGISLHSTKRSSMYFEDRAATVRVSCNEWAHEALHDSGMNEEWGVSKVDMDVTRQEVIGKLLHSNLWLEKAAKIPPPPTTCRNIPAFVEKVANVTTKVAKLKKLSHRRIIKSATLPVTSPSGSQKPGHPARPPSQGLKRPRGNPHPG